MEEFNTIEKVKTLFENAEGWGSENLFFVACQDKQKVNGMVAGMEYPYDGLLINFSEKGIGMFYLKASALSGLITLASPSKMKLEKQSYVFIPTDNIREIKIKNFALFNSKTKRIEINTVEGKSHKLYAKIEEKDFSYQKDNFSKIIEKYCNK